MSDSAAEKLEKNIQARTQNAILVTMGVPLLVVWADEGAALYQAWVGISSDTENAIAQTPAYLNLIAGAASLVIAVFASMSRTFSLHRKFDQVTYRKLAAVNTHIVNELVRISLSMNVRENLIEKLKHSDNYMDLFYNFINKQTTLRSHSFLYWEQYFSAVQLFVFSLFSTAITLAVCFTPLAPNSYMWCAVFPLLLAIFIHLEIENNLSSKLERHASVQINDIKYNNPDEFILQVERRYS